jgi:hypothetical protein
MADRVSASIILGGTINSARYAELAKLITDEGLSTEWDGGPFDPDQRTSGEALRLYAHEVPWGRFGALEDWCVANGVPFERWAGGYPGEWTAERVVFSGAGEPRSYIADEEDRILIDRGIVERLGSLEAILAYFGEADAGVPPLVVVDAAAVAG